MDIRMDTLRIGKAAEQVGISQHALRYYEREGLIPAVNRASNGHRLYTENDLNRVIFVTRLRSSGMSISEIRRYMHLASQGDSTIKTRLALLEAHRESILQKLDEFSQYLQMIDTKIHFYRQSNQ
jgi:DNA-binding transcriptional MerR regulator